MAPKTVLITSITGFLGAQILDDLVKAKYNIKATVRSLDKGKAAVAKYEGVTDIALIEVKDLIHGDLTEALQGVDAVLHVASPFTLKIKDPKTDLLEPAIEGTLNVLRQAQKAGITRVIITSSFAAINDLVAGGAKRDYTYTADDWNPATFEEAAKPDCNPAFSYAASKTLAEQAGWDFAKEHPEMQISAINPPMIYGPSLQAISSEASINTSSGGIWALVSGKTEILPENRLPLFVDARDVSKAHLLALEKPESIGKRFPVYSGAFTWEEAAEYLKTARPEVADKLPKPNPNAVPFEPLAKIDTSEAKKYLGLDKYYDWQTTLVDTVDDLLNNHAKNWH